MPKGFISIGRGAYVRPERVVAIDQAEEDNIYSMGGGFADIKTALLLDNGKVIPGWHKPETIRRNIEKATK